ncbi:M48 family metallopeptidase [Paracoccus sp. MC1862]|nr:M48 family metallopeptidase [Paracoccus sp. MC1854]MBB1498203.1 M48 family metallopeptidase [Paracoccus sp. MC1862]QQO46326.1 M48 family metallopeptidase [Paracoccus sp. MC1862]
MTLRVSRRDGSVTLTLPPSLARAEALAFLDDRSDWLSRALAGVEPQQSVEFGTALPVEGRPLTLTPAPVRAPRVEAALLLLPGGHSAAVSAGAYLRTLAQARLAAASDRHASALGRRFVAITLRDTRSRWGSCTHQGRLMYSWRLAMAPPEVLDYVAAHEVAHLAHMNHSPAFWGTVARLYPGFAQPRAWLRQNGASLHAWRFRAE